METLVGGQDWTVAQTAQPPPGPRWGFTGPRRAPTRHPNKKLEVPVSTRCDIRTDSGMYGFGDKSMSAQTLYAHPIKTASSKRFPSNVMMNGVTHATNSTPLTAWKGKSQGTLVQILPT